MQLLKKHIISVLCLVSILLLALPLISVVTEMKLPIGDATTKATASFNGFQALGKSLLTYVLLLGPALLIAMNYVPQLQKHKGLLAIAIPALCCVMLIIIVLFSSSFSASNSSAKVETSASIGFYLLLVSYIATGIAGAVTYHNFTLDKAGLDKLKGSASGAFGSVQNRMSGAMQNLEARRGNRTPGARRPRPTFEGSEPAPAPAPAPEQPAPKPTVNVDRTEQILQLIQKLAALRDAGILTEQEFQKKKSQLLEEI